ncbi:DUF4097 family beta strand repeat-containing protein [Brevibacterium spongiae]|uniref:DUF4097 domain-containing protein n=1 Tax=Brevibacterium spongiae TaxID=2909672 RepID=A0ABY5SSG7_9MICO|nr:DUF4097 family beta strand repeat-containing protein [Brevibacterium spongiae]UVI36108.1 DUF4097 domain-containing protein [Brevibacterium spongiae]
MIALSSAGFLVALGLSACGPSLDQVDPEGHSFPISGDDLGIIMESGGDIELRPGDVEAVEVTRWFTGDADQAKWTMTDDELVLSTDCGFLTSCEVRYQVVVPQSAAVSLQAANAEVSATDFDTSVSLATENGGIAASDIGGDLTLRSTNGDQHARGLSSDNVTAQAENGSVDLRFDEAPSNLTVTTDNGEVRTSLPKAAYAVSLRTDNGAQSNSLIEDPDSPHTIEVTTGNGDVTLE